MAVLDPLNPGVSRRAFLIGASFVGGCLAVGLTAGPGEAARDDFVPNPFIRIPRKGKITLIMPAVEMGQGVYTAVSMLIAEELEVPLDQIRVEQAPADPSRYANPIVGEQVTGGSFTIRGLWDPMRRAGATTRVMLVNAAAKIWGVPADTCRAQAGDVIHDGTGRRLAYGILAEKAASGPVPREVPLKDPSDFRLIGKTVHRVDGPEKVNGTAKYGIDARPDGLSFAAIAICPAFGGGLRALDDTNALAVNGVTQVVRMEDAVAVVASHFGAARKGLDALAIEWEPGPNGSLTTADLEYP